MSNIKNVIEEVLRNNLGELAYQSLDVILNTLRINKTITPAGISTVQTINKNVGSVNFAPASTSLVVNNSLVTTSSIILCNINTDDNTAVLKNVIANTGSFTIKMAVAPTAETKVVLLVL